MAKAKVVITAGDHTVEVEGDELKAVRRTARRLFDQTSKPGSLTGSAYGFQFERRDAADHPIQLDGM
jgi:hypothetical protein